MIKLNKKYKIIISILLLIIIFFIINTCLLYRYKKYINQQLNYFLISSALNMGTVEKELQNVLSNKKINESQYHSIYHSYETFYENLKKVESLMSQCIPKIYYNSVYLSEATITKLDIEAYLYRLKFKLNFSSYGISPTTSDPKETKLNKEDLDKLSIVYKTTQSFKKIILESYDESNMGNINNISNNNWISVVEKIYKYCLENGYNFFNQ